MILIFICTGFSHSSYTVMNLKLYYSVHKVVAMTFVWLVTSTAHDNKKFKIRHIGCSVVFSVACVLRETKSAINFLCEVKHCSRTCILTPSGHAKPS